MSHATNMALSFNSMETIEVCKVAPANSPPSFELPLTFLDTYWLPSHPPSRLFFYEFPEPNTDLSRTFLDKLKNSLAVALQHYLPVAGYLTWPRGSDSPVVRYHPGDGVSLTVTETRADFYALSGDDFRESKELRSLLPDFPTSETQSPVMTLRITLFPSVGFCVAYVAHHGVMDGKSISLFMHSWAYLCKNGFGSFLPNHLTPSFDRSFVEHQAELRRVYPKSVVVHQDLENKVLTVYDLSPLPDMVIGTFTLTGENIDRLKSSVLSYSGTRISSFTAASAYMMVCFVKARKVASEKTFVGFSVDSRARLDPPLPSTYFGNCVLGCGRGRDTKDFLLENNGFQVAVEVISEALASLNEGVVKVAGKVEGLNSLYRDYGGLAIAGSPRFEYYKVDFGFGKLTKVGIVYVDKIRGICLTDDRNGNGGVEIGIGLEKHEAEAFASIFSTGLVTC